MDYYNYIKSLNKEIFSFTNYKKINLPLKILCGIATLLFSLSALIWMGFYYLTLVVYYCIKSPVDYLLKLIKDEGKEVKHATQFIIYFIGFPFIFLANILLSILACLFFIYNLLINIDAYLATLGGINFHPFLFNEKQETTYKSLSFITTIIYGGVNLVLLVLFIIFFFVLSHPLYILFEIGLYVFSAIFLKFALKEDEVYEEINLIEPEDYQE